MVSTQQLVSVGGHRIRLTNLEKVLYPETGTTKGDVIDYYARIADVLIPHAANRPATRKRWVHGVGTADDPGDMFFQKNLDDSTPAWVRRRSIQHRGHANDYPLVNDVATLTWLGQIAALEIHVPQWRFGRTGVQKNPDRMVLDLDPGAGAGLAECVEVARIARAILQGMGLAPLPVTSGSKGIHLYTPLDGRQTSSEVSAVAHELARAIEADHPDLAVSDMRKTLREGRVLVDWSQNNENKTTITPYSLRGRLRPTVAAPRTWEELEEPDFRQLEYEEVLARVAAEGDLLAPLGASRIAALEPTTERMSHFTRTGDESGAPPEPSSAPSSAPPSASGEDRLARYRRMRTQGKTPEPVPDEAPTPSNGLSFVIQEHHARRLHWDFRLEHDGVLVSWALPKGVPTESDKNHLAVQTEDHPIEYGSFEGEIPHGEYGAGHVEIWDAGSYELEKWRDGEEVIVMLHGEKHGSHKYALIHTGRGEKDENNWLIHLMGDEAAPHRLRRSARGTLEADGANPPSSRGVLSRGPMLATLGDENDITGDEDWAFETKWDGIRAIAVVEGGTARLVSRAGNDLTASYPELADLAKAITGDAIVDGEIVAFDSRGRPDFGLLQRRMGVTKPADVQKAMKLVSVHYLLFDVVERDGKPLADASYDDRRTALEEIVSPTARIQIPAALEGDIHEALAMSRELGLEGVVAKKRDGRYSVGRRSAAWIKIKHVRTQEVVVGGWRPGKGTRADRMGSLLLGIPNGEELEYVGRVGTGFSERDIEAITTRLRGMGRKTSPFAALPGADAADAHFVTPSLVGEVQFAEWTGSGRLRHPSWRGWRPDKSPSEVARETHD